jgi:DNA polymerase-3 subunit delta
MDSDMSRPAYSICICPDSRLLYARLDALLAAHAPLQGGTWQRFVFWADEGLGPSFWEHLTLQGLFAAPKALIIRNAQILTADALKVLSNALLPLAGSPAKPLPSPLIWPLCCLEVSIEKGKAKVPAHIANLPCYLEVEKRGWLDVTQGLSAAALPAFIQSEAQRQGLVPRPEEAEFLAHTLPPDAAFITSELAKLALLADSKGRLPKTALAASAQAQEVTIFELMRIVQQNSDAPAAWQLILADKLAGENMVFAFTAILLREARLLWQSLAGPAPYLPPQVARQKKIAAETLGYGGIARLWELALQTDKGIKSGERSPDQAFEMLAADLFLLFGGQHSR